MPQGCPSAKQKKKDLRNANQNERLRRRSLLHGHGTFSTSKVGGWRLAVGGSWRRLVVGGWQLVVDGGLAVRGWWRLSVGFGGPWGLSLRAVRSKKKQNLVSSEKPCVPTPDCPTLHKATCAERAAGHGPWHGSHAPVCCTGRNPLENDLLRSAHIPQVQHRTPGHCTGRQPPGGVGNRWGNRDCN